MIQPRAHRLLPLPITLVALSLWGSVPAGQTPGEEPKPTVSADLANHPKSLHTHRVIVQAPESALGSLRRGVAGLLRRNLKPGAVALEVTDAQLDALQSDPRFAHISG